MNVGELYRLNKSMIAFPVDSDGKHGVAEVVIPHDSVVMITKIDKSRLLYNDVRLSFLSGERIFVKQVSTGFIAKNFVRVGV